MLLMVDIEVNIQALSLCGGQLLAFHTFFHYDTVIRDSGGRNSRGPHELLRAPCLCILPLKTLFAHQNVTILLPCLIPLSFMSK